LVDRTGPLDTRIARIQVTDQGPGIPDEFRSRIFQKFSQADSSDTRAKSGTGLGLSICKAIIEQMGGTIGYETQVGRGSTFYFELPQAIDAASLAAVG
jgi:signal transduction histidine kinase